MNKHLLNNAIKKAGSQAALARELKCTRQHICNLKRGFPAGTEFALKVLNYVKADSNRHDVQPSAETL